MTNMVDLLKSGQAYCGRPGCENPGSQICGRCKGVAYCNKECQKEHWKVHKASCQNEQRDIRIRQAVELYDELAEVCNVPLNLSATDAIKRSVRMEELTMKGMQLEAENVRGAAVSKARKRMFAAMQQAWLARSPADRKEMVAGSFDPDTVSKHASLFEECGQSS